MSEVIYVHMRVQIDELLENIYIHFLMAVG